MRDGPYMHGQCDEDLRAMTAERDALLLQKDEAAKRAEFWKANHLAGNEEIQRLERLNGELQKELAGLQHTGQHMTCGQCEQLRETQKRVQPPSICDMQSRAGDCYCTLPDGHEGDHRSVGPSWDVQWKRDGDIP